MILVRVREFNGSTLYDYDYGNGVLHWSMKYYREADINNVVLLRNYRG